uniref:Uncharacterized protein n=1 Tax=Trieres chinensis TaxID=1514140 RepID=A0A7S1ZC40_TRICV
MSTLHSGLLCPNFTENGWGLTRAPQGLVDDLRRSLHRGLAGDLPEETLTQCIEGENRPKMIKQYELNARALRELKHIHEAWAGRKLVGNNAYGLRVYRNESGLNMHIDKTETHIISSILHVDHDPMGDPWPIVIEDYQGNLNEVYLEPGDMLLYESSKCFHGRPKPFNGLWYSSLFIHYYPEDWPAGKIKMDAHYRVPPSWHKQMPKEDGLEDFVVIETSVKEPQCEHGWCGMKNTVKWSGPAEGYGKVLSAGGKVSTLLDLATKEPISEKQGFLGVDAKGEMHGPYDG